MTAVGSGKDEETGLGVSFTSQVPKFVRQPKPIVTPKLISIVPNMSIWTFMCWYIPFVNQNISQEIFKTRCNTKVMVKNWQWKIYQKLALRHLYQSATGSAREEQTDVTMALVRALTTPPIVRKAPAAAGATWWKMVCLHRRGLS